VLNQKNSMKNSTYILTCDRQILTYNIFKQCVN